MNHKEPLFRLDKKKSRAFGKDIYLLGMNEDKMPIWLESPKWDCEWYWGFGYVETYTNKWNPNRSRDIQSHEHFDGYVWFKNEQNIWVAHFNESPRILGSVLTGPESWELSDLMKRFYTLREAAEIFYSGSAHLASSPKINSQNGVMYNEINTQILPPIFARIIEILTPSSNEDK